MSVLGFPLRHREFTLVAFVCLVVLGGYAFTSIPREEDPSFPYPAFLITVVDPGADPKDLERTVAKPIEDRLAELDAVKKIETTITDGVAALGIEFQISADAEKKFDEVTREINALRPTLPPDLERIEIRKQNPGLVNIVELALVSDDAPYPELEDRARALKDALKAVDGVRTAETWAYPPRELRVELDLKRMAELRLLPGQVLAALQSENANVPAGFVDLGPRTFSLRTAGSYASLDEVRDTVIASGNDHVVRVRDVAQVSWSTRTASYLGRYNGHRAVFVTANQKDGYNILAVEQRIDAALGVYAQTLPPRIRLERGFEQSRNVGARLDRLYRDFLIAIALVLLTLLPLGLRAAGVVMISIPLALACGLAALYFLGYSLNQLSIAGFVLALGLLVDDSIVVTENIVRHLRLGLTRVEAALAGTRQILVAIIGCTATLIFAFLPLLALPGPPGKFIAVLPTTVVATIVGSLFIAIFLIPFLASSILAPTAEAEGNFFLRRVMGAIERYYRPALRYCLARPGRTVAVALGGSLLLSALLVPLIGTSLFPKADTPQFIVSIEAPNGTSLAETDRALRFVESRLAAMPEVRSSFANLGHGNPQIYYNHIVRNDASNFAEVFVQLGEYDTRRTPARIDALRRSLENYPAARIYVKEFVNGPPISAPIAVRVIGPDLEVIGTLAARVEKLIADTPGTRDVRNPLKFSRTNLKLALDPQKASLLGVRTADFERAVRLSVSGLPAGTFKDATGEQYDIVLRTPIGERADLAALGEVRVPTDGGGTLPLSALARLEFEKAPTMIQRYDRERAVTIDSEVERGANTASVTAAVVRRLDANPLPPGYRYELGGEAQSGAESFGGIGTAIIVAVFGIFAILVLEFGSFQSTLIVLTVVPLGLFGGLCMLLVTGNSISFTAAIGFVALVGIEIKNSILLVDFTNQLRAAGVPLDTAIAQAGEIRFLPILLTSATAIGGLLPLALQNIGLYSPMAWAIIGGLIASTLLARLVTPVMYKLMPPAVAPRPEAQPNAPLPYEKLTAA